MKILKFIYLLFFLMVNLFSANAYSDDLLDSLVNNGPIVILEIDGTINPATVDYLKSGFAEIDKVSGSALLVKLNTPGGLLPSTQTITQLFLDSKVPVFIFVSPKGGGAISAGVFITMAAHVAAMAPGTTIGAAHPVSGDGKNVEGDMRGKVENFAASMNRAIAEQRGRNVSWAEKAVRESVSLTDREAVIEKVVDFTAEDTNDLLKKAIGKKIKVDNKEVTLPDLSAREKIALSMTMKQLVVNTISDPNVTGLLGAAAMGGIIAEFYHPGLIIPGLIGVICLILTLVASQVIPINTGGVGLLLLGGVLILVEAFTPTFGVLGLIGVACFALGAIYAVDTSFIWAAEGFSVDKVAVGGISFTIGLIILGLVLLASNTLKQKVVTGKEGLIGKRARIKKIFTPIKGSNKFRGKVEIDGETWNADIDSELKNNEIGNIVEVVSVSGIILIVKEK